MKNNSIAFDRASVRTIDGYGHLRVATSPISKANVCPYYGREIPGADRLGLDPNKIYMLYRDPAELEKAAPTFAGKPILLRHLPVSASEHPREIVVGAIGDDIAFRAPYLTAPLTIWDGEAIGLIQTDEQRELSCSYGYAPDMTPGVTPEGERYDGRMINIEANHLALVEEGRAGPDVLVGDAALVPEKPPPTNPTEKIEMAKKPIALTRQALLVEGALAAYIKPKLAQDAKLDLKPMLSGVTAKNFKQQRPAIVKAAAALDAAIETDDLEKILEVVEALGPVDEPAIGDDLPEAGDPATDADGLSDEEEVQYQALAKRRKPVASDEDAGKGDEDKDKVSKAAMDAAITAATKETENRVRAHLRDIAVAEDDVRPFVGKIAVACDSAADVYRHALESMNVDLSGVHPSAFRAILKSQPQPKPYSSTAVAMDAAAQKSFDERFPHANRLK